MAFQLKRRTLFAAGAGALAAPSLLAGIAGAQETTEKGGTAMSADFRTLKLGSFKVTVISDGTRAADKPHEIFGTNQPAESVSKLLEENFLRSSTTRTPIAASSTAFPRFWSIPDPRSFSSTPGLAREVARRARASLRKG